MDVIDKIVLETTRLKSSWFPPGHIETGEYIPKGGDNVTEKTESYMESIAKDNVSDDGNPKYETCDKTDPIPRQERYSLRMLFRISALALSVAASIISAWFSFGSIAENLPVSIAIILSGIVVFSATIAPELVILLTRKKRFVLAPMVVIVGLIASAYSMTTTIAGQYNSRMAQGGLAIASERQKREEARLIDEIARLNVSIDTYQARITRATNEGKTDANATELKRRDTVKKSEYEALLATAQSGIVVQRVDFYAWIGSILGVSGDTVEFTASVLPALLLDVAAPVFAVCFMVV